MPKLRAMSACLTLVVSGGCLVAAASIGCQTQEKKCEHARDVMLAVADEAVDRALATLPPTERAQIEATSKAEIDRARSVFVGKCLELDEAGMACIARIDELVAAGKQVDVAVAEARKTCPKDELGLPASDCVDEARESARARTDADDCDATLEALAERVYADAPQPSDPAATP